MGMNGGRKDFPQGWADRGGVLGWSGQLKRASSFFLGSTLNGQQGGPTFYWGKIGPWTSPASARCRDWWRLDMSRWGITLRSLRCCGALRAPKRRRVEPARPEREARSGEDGPGELGAGGQHRGLRRAAHGDVRGHRPLPGGPQRRQGDLHQEPSDRERPPPARAVEPLTVFRAASSEQAGVRLPRHEARGPQPPRSGYTALSVSSEACLHLPGVSGPQVRPAL